MYLGIYDSYVRVRAVQAVRVSLVLLQIRLFRPFLTVNLA